MTNNNAEIINPNDKVQKPKEAQSSKSKYDLPERLLLFSTDVGKLGGILPTHIALKEYLRQVIRSSASIGANYEEADGTLTKRDFVNKIAIARREAKETKYWLRLIGRVADSESESSEKLSYLIKEVNEIVLILSAIINKTIKRL